MAWWKLVKSRGRLLSWQASSAGPLADYKGFQQGYYIEQRRWISRYVNKSASRMKQNMDEVDTVSRLKAYNKSDPNYVIQWYERSQPDQWYIPGVLREYVRALVKANKLDNSELLATLQEGVKARLGVEMHGSASPFSGSSQSLLGTMGNTSNGGALGSENAPIHTISLDSGFKEQFWKTIRFLSLAFLAVAALGALIEDKASISKGLVGLSEEIQPVIETSTKFSDVKGVDEAKADLEEIVAYLKDPKRFTRLGGKLPKGVLLIGAPGTGKTMLARAIAGEAGVPFFYCSGSEFEEVFVGVGARRIRDLFTSAKKRSPCIVFIDEIDAVGGKRNPKDQQYVRMTLNQLLVELDGFKQNEGIIVIGATNFPDSLDKALVRPGRFDRITTVPLPDVHGRTEILEVHMSKVKMSDDVDLSVVARGTHGFSGADLANLVNIAALKAATDGAKSVGMAELDSAKDKIMMGAERKSAVRNEQNLKRTAYHEGGHALVAIHMKGANPIHKATIIPRGPALGMVLQLPKVGQIFSTRKEMVGEMAVAMGGRAAEELIFGQEEVTSGASSDLRMASNLAREMVTKYGMSKAVGPVSNASKKLSTDSQDLVDTEVRELLWEAYNNAMDILKTHEEELHMLAKALLERETMTEKEIKDLIAQAKSYSVVVPTSLRAATSRSIPPFPLPAAVASATAAAGNSAATAAKASTGSSPQPFGS